MTSQPPPSAERPPPTTDPPSPAADGAPPSRRRHSGLGVTAFVLALMGFLIGWFPLAGLVGTIGLVLAVIELNKDTSLTVHTAETMIRDPQTGQITATAPGAMTTWTRARLLPGIAVALGALATLAAIGWVVIGKSTKVSCPYVYAFDGSRWHLDAEPLGGALFRAGERDDLARLEHLAPAAGSYRLRLANELDEVDHLDTLALLAVDHAPLALALPTPSGAVLVVSGGVPPRAARDGRGRDLRATLERDDGVAHTGRVEDFSPTAAAEPRERVTLLFDRPRGTTRAVLVLRARSTPFAEEAFARYLGEMGAGLGAVLYFAGRSERYPYARRLADEARRLGMTLVVQVRDGSGWRPAAEVRPIGPAVLRRLAVPLELSPGGATVELRLEHSPLLWEIDQALLAPAPPTVASVIVLRPRGARDRDGRDRLEPLLARDGRRLVLRRGEHVEVVFDVPPPPVVGLSRTLLLAVRGYYEVAIRGRGGYLNPFAILRHRSGSDSLPRYALRLARGGQPPP